MQRPPVVIGGLLAAAVAAGALYGAAKLTVEPRPAAAAAALTATATAASIEPTVAPTPTAPPTATPTGTATATATATPPPKATPSPTPVVREPLPAVELRGITHVWQTWNNCGPATLSMYLSYYGKDLTQAEIAEVLRPYRDDKNVTAEEMARYARSQGYEALARANGSVDMLRLLLSNGIPVVVETWYEPPGEEGMGHYRLLTGYDDDSSEWVAYDSYDTASLRAGEDYRGSVISYADLDELWPVLGRGYVLVYPASRAPTVTAIVGEDLDERVAWQGAIATAEAEVVAHTDDVYAWFSLGSALTAVGRYEEAAAAFERAEALGWPRRLLWYRFGIFEAAIGAGKPDWAIRLADGILDQTSSIEEIWYWKGRALAAEGRTTAAASAYERAIELNPNFSPAVEALAGLGEG